MSSQNNFDEIEQKIINKLVEKLVHFIENLRANSVPIIDTIKGALKRFKLPEQISVLYNVIAAERGVKNFINVTPEYIRPITEEIGRIIGEYYNINPRDIFSITLHTIPQSSNYNYTVNNNNQIPINSKHPIDLEPTGKSRKKNHKKEELPDGRYKVTIPGGKMTWQGKCPAVQVGINPNGSPIYQDQTLIAEELEDGTYIVGCGVDPSLSNSKKLRR